MTGDNVLKSLFHLNRYVSGTKTDRHNHAYAELLYVSDGSLTQHISGDDVHMKKGDVCLINSDCVHWESFEDEAAFVIRLEVSGVIVKALITNSMADEQASDYIKELGKALKNSGYIHFTFRNHLERMVNPLQR